MLHKQTPHRIIDKNIILVTNLYMYIIFDYELRDDCL